MKLGRIALCRFPALCGRHALPIDLDALVEPVRQIIEPGCNWWNLAEDRRVTRKAVKILRLLLPGRKGKESRDGK